MTLASGATQAAVMTRDVSAMVDRAEQAGGVLTYDDAAQCFGPRALEQAARRGLFVRLFPGTYVPAGCANDPDVRLRAAVAFAGPNAAASHLSALRVWQLPAPSHGSPHVTVWGGRQPRGAATFHRASDPPPTVVRGGLCVVCLEIAVVTSWALIGGPDQRAPVLAAVSQRRTTVERLRAAVHSIPNLPGRRALLRLLTLLAAGCHSALELWGYTHVFRHPSLPRSVGQLRVRLESRNVYLDRGYEREMVDVELDGAADHTSAADRERDLRRDAALVRRGWVVLRYTHTRLRNEPEAVRAEVLAVLTERRRQLALAE